MGSYAAGWPFADAHTTTQYSRRNIQKWLLHYPNVFWSSEAASSIRWAEVKADIDLAVREQPPHLREFFRLYCVEGYEPGELTAMKGWTERTCNDYWARLRRNVCRLMCDSTHDELTPAELDRLPTFRTDSFCCGDMPIGNFLA